MRGTAYGSPMHGIAAVTSPERGSAASLRADQMAYKVDSAARILDLSERLVWTLVKSGEIDSFTVGRSRLITREALQTFIARKQAECRGGEA